MHVITRKRLNDFTQNYPDAHTALDHWYRLIKKNNFKNFVQLREFFPSADQVDNKTVFNIGGNKYRLIAAVHYQSWQSLYSCYTDPSRIRQRSLEKEYSMTLSQINKTKAAWPSVADTLRVPHSDLDYQELVDLLDSLIDEVGEDEDHPLASLMEVIGVLIKKYEDEHVPELGN